MTRLALLFATLAVGVASGPVFAQAGTGGDVACLTCHGEPEFLRSSVPTAAEARALHVPQGPLAASGHADMNCAECHTSFARYPHPEAAESLTCATASCHTVQTHPEWEGSVHARIQEDDGLAAADCAACHGVHDVAPLEALQREAGPAQQRMNGQCVSCHLEQAYTAADPHADSTSCAACHAPHATAEVAAPESWIAPLNQLETCGTCHEAAADSVRTDIHRATLVEQDRRDPLVWPFHETVPEGDSLAPTCSDCHGAHPASGAGTTPVDSLAFQTHMIERCASCHTASAETYYYTYHGKATRLGSGVSASCAQCHGAHSVMPADSAASAVHADALIGTCGECHEQARAAFVRYDSHPEPGNRDRNPWLFYSFYFMNSILIGTLVVFGLHTALWWIRIWIDAKKTGAEPGRTPRDPQGDAARGATSGSSHA